MTNIREIVLDALLEIEKEGKSSSEVMNNTLAKYGYLTKQERSFISRLIRGTLENEIRLDYIIGLFSKLPASKMKPLIRILLRMSVYQLYEMNNIPASAAINEAVKLAKKRGFNSLSGFVNGILRNITRDGDKIKFPDKEKNFKKYISVNYSLPEWLVGYWMGFLHKDAVEIMAKDMLNSDRALTINVDTNKISLDKLTEEFEAQGITVFKGEYSDYSLKIKDFDNITALPHFDEGLYFIQDESSMNAVEAADIKPGNLVIDVCASPGGKSMLAARKVGAQGKVISRDVSSNKTERIIENVDRMGLSNVEVKVFDARVLDDEYVKKADVVLADLPCSGLGVIGKKPDIKKNMSLQGIKDLAALQKEILTTVSNYVKPGGVLVFSTCTVSKEENEDNVKWFTENFPFELQSVKGLVSANLSDKNPDKGYIRIIQGKDNCDGGFAARFVRRND